jgi:hypothetical protein
MTEKIEENNCYYIGENDKYCHKGYVDSISKNDCNLCKNINCEAKQIKTLTEQNAILVKALEEVAEHSDRDKWTVLSEHYHLCEINHKATTALSDSKNLEEGEIND